MTLSSYFHTCACVALLAVSSQQPSGFTVRSKGFVNGRPCGSLTPFLRFPYPLPAVPLPLTAYREPQEGASEDFFYIRCDKSYTYSLYFINEFAFSEIGAATIFLSLSLKCIVHAPLNDASKHHLMGHDIIFKVVSLRKSLM